MSYHNASDMTPEEFREIRERLGLSLSEVCGILGIKDRRTGRRWEAGERPIHPTIAKLMRKFDSGDILISDME